ncbi:hypothetical protein CLCR_04408 [Cladophialophora carrionii]|uniref:Uncharacterized protein n=1 Tax=Cladophialophora carrionii TaxID=86049 RepID=A0A1C1CI18_9EURO|nr:hypothetical protein CLCR_04408 [Cladophialophora carrionii]
MSAGNHQTPPVHPPDSRYCMLPSQAPGLNELRAHQDLLSPNLAVSSGLTTADTRLMGKSPLVVMLCEQGVRSARLVTTSTSQLPETQITRVGVYVSKNMSALVPFCLSPESDCCSRERSLGRPRDGPVLRRTDWSTVMQSSHTIKFAFQSL